MSQSARSLDVVVAAIDRVLDAIGVVERWVQGDPVACHDLTNGLTAFTDIGSTGDVPVMTNERYGLNWTELVDAIQLLRRGQQPAPDVYAIPPASDGAS